MNSSLAHLRRPLPTALVVVGSGAAGLFLALRAARRRPVSLITKGPLEDGSTRYAQGGIAAAVGGDDCAAEHLADTIAAGAGLCDPGAAAAIAGEGPARLADLVGLGVAFDREGQRGAIALAREAAHGRARVAHAGGDATGAHISAALAAAVLAHPQIVVVTGETAVEIVVRDGRAVGVRSRDRSGDERVHAGEVALATGGMGQLYAFTTNPAVATGDGQALAHRAGAALADLELIQFHPTALALGDSPLSLVTEAARGEGGVLRDARGRAFMADLHPLADLAPRDVVARAIWARARDDGRPVTLDMRAVEPEQVRRRFPTVAAICARHGLDLARDPIPVTPAAHYAMGGVMTDLSGRTTLPGLWAVGECATTGAHGANRLASNSLLEAVVLAGRAGEATLREEDWPAGPAAPAVPPPIAGTGPDPRAELQRIMWDGAGVERDAAGLADAARALADLPAPADPATANLREIAGLLVGSAQLRAESRGAHFRRDHPETRADMATRIAVVGGDHRWVPLDAGRRRPLTTPTTTREAA